MSLSGIHLFDIKRARDVIIVSNEIQSGASRKNDTSCKRISPTILFTTSIGI